MKLDSMHASAGLAARAAAHMAAKWGSYAPPKEDREFLTAEQRTIHPDLVYDDFDNDTTRVAIEQAHRER